MALISNGIEGVRAFELPGGIWADGSGIAVPRLALVRWRSGFRDKFHQIYVNGQYAGVTVDDQQRQMIVQMPMSLEVPVSIEVFAVEVEDADTDFSGELGSSIGHSGRVRISVLRGQDLPIDATAQIYSDGGNGEVDYDSPVNDIPLRVWPAWQDKGGFGMSRFGISDFGYDSAAAVGFGKGGFGWGQFGLEADTFEWVSRPMQVGVYRFAVKIANKMGNDSSSSETREVTVIPAARPAEQMSISSFDKQTNQLILSVS